MTSYECSSLLSTYINKTRTFTCLLQHMQIKQSSRIRINTASYKESSGVQNLYIKSYGFRRFAVVEQYEFIEFAKVERGM